MFLTLFKTDIMVLCSTIPLCSLSYVHAHVGNVEKYYRFPTGKIKRIILLIDFYRKKKDLFFFLRVCVRSLVLFIECADVEHGGRGSQSA